MVWTVTELVVGQSFVWQAKRPGVKLIAGHYLSPVRVGTVSLTLTLDQKGLVGHMLERLTAKVAKRYLLLEAEGHKRSAEAHD
jgi:hypothetical protein